MQTRFFTNIVFVFAALALQAQGTLELKLKVFRPKGAPVVGLEVTCVEPSLGKTEKFKTDAEGKVLIILSEGREWWLNIGELEKVRLLKVPESGYATGNQNFPYDPVNMKKKLNFPDRTAINFNLEDQSKMASGKPDATHCLLTVNLISKVPANRSSIEVIATCIENQRKYKGVTDALGKINLLVPIGATYFIDVDGVENLHEIQITKAMGYGTMGIELTYTPTEINEKEYQDTIVQRLKQDQKPTTGRALVHIGMNNTDGQTLANQYVWLAETKSTKVYKALTDAQGVAHFLLPVNKKYLIHFQFQRDVDVVDLDPRYMRVSESTMKFTYHPNPRLENPLQFVPSIDEVFLNDFQNFITKQWPKARKNQMVDVFFHWGNVVNAKSKEALLELNFVSAEPGTELGGRAPMNICFVLDKSGSMAGYDRIESMIAALQKFVDKLSPADVVSLIVFDDQPMVVFPSTKKGTGQELKDVISAIRAGGGTNIYKGLQLGFAEITKNMAAKGNNRIVLLSDGYGSTEPEIIINEAKEYVAKGVEITAIGVGQNYNYALMSQLASLSGGLIEYVASSDQMDKVFGENLARAIFPIAENFKVDIVYNDAIKFKHLYGFEFANKAPIASLSIPTVFAGMQRMALVKFDLPKPNPQIEQVPVIIRFSYTSTITKKLEKFEENAILKWSPFTGDIELSIDHEQKKLYSIAIMNQTIKVMADAFARSDYKSAKEAINRCKAQVENLYPAAKEKDVNELYQSLISYSAALDQLIKNQIMEQKKKGIN